MLSEALADVDPARHGLLAGEAAVALAEAGLADDERTKIAGNTECWPDDLQVRLLAGDALVILGNTEAALAQFQVAVLLAQQAEDFKAIRALSTRDIPAHPSRRRRDDAAPPAPLQVDPIPAQG